MIDPFALDALRDAREQLYTSARHCMRHGGKPHDWQVHHAAAWALDLTTQRDVAAVVALVWGIE